MYLAWRAAKRSPRPIVVLIGGATGVGKSTVATKLAGGLGITRVIPTDTVRGCDAHLHAAIQAPELHSLPSRWAGADATDPWVPPPEPIGRTGSTGCSGRMIAEHKDSIVEGIHLVPGCSTKEMLHRFRLEAAVVKVLLTLPMPRFDRATS